jgi:Tol biopolymer transport system component/DNA-binding winged helix-turn-helix (wHTH) protein
MVNPMPSARRARLGEFHLDLDSGELFGNGTPVRLQVQSLELLKALMERPGLMVGREELRHRLWPDETFVDFEHGLNAAVRRLREALGDSADAPRFIETIPRKGYRLVADTDLGVAAAVQTSAAQAPPAIPHAEVVPTAGALSPRLLAILAAVPVVLAAGAWLWNARPSSASRPPVAAFTIELPAGWQMRVLDMLSLSPDSRYIAFTAVGPDSTRALWVRPLAGSAARQIVSAGNPLSPFWSPDSNRIGFFQLGQLSAVSLADASTQVLAVITPSLSGLDAETISKLDISDPLIGGAATWMDNGDIVFTPLFRSGLERLARGASAARPLGDPREYRTPWPQAVPGTDRFTFVEVNRGASDRVGRIAALGGAAVVELGRVDSRLVPTSSGYGVFARDGALIAQRLHDTRGFIGDPIVLADDVAVRLPTLGHFSATSDVLVYLTRAALRSDTRLMIVDRHGVELGSVGDTGFYSNLRMSPDGTRIAVGLEDPLLGTRDIWVHDVTGKPPLRLTFDPSDDMAPNWSADGRTVLFSSDRSGERDIYTKDAAAQQPETLVFASEESKSLNTWSRDGRSLVYDTGARGVLDARGRFNRADLFVVSLDRPPRVRPLATTPAHEAIADISPDGTLVAYHSSETGSTEVFVETFPAKGGRWQVTSSGAIEPMWREDGRELFFLTRRDEVASVEVFRSSEGVRFGPQRVVFKRPGTVDQVRSWAPFPDGQRFVVLAPVSAPKPQQIQVRVNWRSGLPAK